MWTALGNFMLHNVIRFQFPKRGLVTWHRPNRRWRGEMWVSLIALILLFLSIKRFQVAYANLLVFSKHYFEVRVLCFVLNGTLEDLLYKLFSLIDVIYFAFIIGGLANIIILTKKRHDHISPSPSRLTRPDASYAPKTNIFYNWQDVIHTKLHRHNWAKFQISNLSLVIPFF